MGDDRAEAFFRRGWLAFPPERSVQDWVRAVAPEAARLEADPTLRARWLRCGGTWFAGVNVLGNDAEGSVAEGPPLACAALDFAADALGLGRLALDAGQVSVCRPGYPRRDAGESEAAYRYRLKRDAAHVDGLLPVGPERRRMAVERHGFLLGVPLAGARPGASPVVVWEGSHETVRRALVAALEGVPPERWAETEVTEAYHAARRECFETLPRVEVGAEPGGAYLLHRLALHGVAPWTAPDGPPRAVAYFRPEPLRPAASDWWLADP
jgi:hypothetical protein